MPKISAPTVAEHRTAQHAAMLAAAEEILLSDGIDAVTPSAVTSRAGLARSTFYEYFPSKDDLLVALARAAFEKWGDEMSSAVQAASPGRDRLATYVRTTLRLTGDGRHGMATALRGVPLSPKGREDIAALHTALDDPLGEILADLNVADVRTTATLIHGLLGAAMTLVAAGRSEEAVSNAAVSTILDGVPSP